MESIIFDLESTKINCNYILYDFNWFLNIISWNISMLKVQHVFQIKIFLCAQGGDYFHSFLRE